MFRSHKGKMGELGSMCLIERDLGGNLFHLVPAIFIGIPTNRIVLEFFTDKSKKERQKMYGFCRRCHICQLCRNSLRWFPETFI